MASLIHKELSDKVLGAASTCSQRAWAGMEAQIINYLRLSRLPVGYLLNFANTRVEWKRFVNQRV